VKTGTVNNDAATDLQVAKDEILLEARQGVVSATKADGTAVAGAKLPVLGDTWWVLPNLGETSYVTQPQIDALTSGGINLVILEYKQMSNDSIFQSDEAGQSQVAYAAERDDGVQIRSLFLSQNYGPVCPVPLSVD
jgi:hypothetical protein